MHLARGICPLCKTGMTAFSDETGVPETLDSKCPTCKWGRVLIEVQKDPASDTVVPTMKMIKRSAFDMEPPT